MIMGVFVMHYELCIVLEPTATGTTAEATTEATATRTATTEAATATTRTTRTTRTARTTRAAKATATVLEASKEIQTVDDVYHTIAGNGVILCIIT